MKVLLASSGSGSRGGGEIFLDYLGRALNERGHEVLMWMPKHPRMDELAGRCESYAKVIRSDYRNTYDHLGRTLTTCFTRAVSRRIAWEWNQLQPDVIHVNKQNLEDGLDLLRALQRCSSPSICTIHLTQSPLYLGARMARLRTFIARAELNNFRGALVAVGEARSAELRSLLGPDAAVRTIVNGVPRTDPIALQALRDATRNELGLAPHHFLALAVGRLVAQKRPLVFLEIARQLHLQYADARFLWVGSGPLLEPLQQAIINAGLQDVVTCTGWQGNVLPYLAAGDLLLHTAEYEGHPLAVIEAMAAGLPCALTSSLSSEIAFVGSGNVLIADDVSVLANQVQDRMLLDRISANGRRLIEEQFSDRIMAEAYERLYIAAMKMNAPGRGQGQTERNARAPLSV